MALLYLVVQSNLVVLEVPEVHHRLVVPNSLLALVVLVAPVVLKVPVALNAVDDHLEDEVELKLLCRVETGLEDCLEDLEMARLRPFLGHLE